MNAKRVALVVLAAAVIAAVSVGAGIGIGSAIFKSSSTNASSESTPGTTTTSTTTNTAPLAATSTAPKWLAPFEPAVDSIFSYLIRANGKGRGIGYNWLANLTDTFGNRMTGSQRLKDATNYVVNTFRAQGFNNVHTEPAPIKSWIRGEEVAELLSPRRYRMAVLGLGMSVPTPPEGIIAPAFVVDSFDELTAAGKEKINGTIVVFNEPWLGSYGVTVRYRAGASQASYYGAVAVLVRSVTTFSIYSPHTGVAFYSDTINGVTVKPIPQASITVEDAMMLRRMQDRGQPLEIYLKMTSHSNGTVYDDNIIFEWTGSQYPNQYIVLSGHFDSWDVGQGAMDDGGGCTIAWNTLMTLRSLNLQPKRTVRAIFWVGEELDNGGANTYFAEHKNSSEEWIFAFESDEGAFMPSGPANNTILAVKGNATAVQRLQDIADYMIAANGIPFSAQFNEEAGGEVYLWSELGSVTASYMNQEKFNEYYFYFHHSNGDTMTVLKPEDLDYVTAVMAIYTHIIANMDQRLSVP